MTRDDVIRLAREAGAGVALTMSSQPQVSDALFRGKSLESFVHLVIADFLARTGQYVTNDASREAALDLARGEEREACAKVCDDNHWEDHRLFADAIRARGQK